MIFINPATLIENNYIPPVFITGLQINNQGMTVNNSSYLSKAVPYTSDITLPYDSSNITLEVAALSYTIPNKNEFSYKMEGFDKDWTFIKTNRKIYYTQLPPGDYIFKVKGTNSDGIWNEKETVLNIKILSPFWATNWAYLLYTIIILGVVFTILNYSYRAIKDKNLIIIKEIEIEKERAIHTAKIDFITNITHEIRTPLTLIKLPLDKLFNSLSSNPILKENLNMINKNTNRLIDLTNQILDFRKVEAHNYNLSIIKTDINNILEELFIEYKPIAENKKINYTLKMPRLSLFADVDPEAFRKIISNLINNALKYSKEFVSVRLYPYSSEDDHFKIEFSNDGLIIPNDLKEKIFEPFYRIKQTENVTGTGIGLTLCRSLAELHNGILEIKIREDKLNTFILTLPILKENKQN
jgi:signal transduction histidine kinase